MLRTFSKTDYLLYGSSVVLISAAFFIFDRAQYLNLAASLIGVTSLIFSAKGHPVGPLLMIVFSVLYGIISYSYCYYGEMITYLGMTLPMSVISLVEWLRHPYKGNRSQVSIARLSYKEHLLMWGLNAVVTVIFYGILAYFHTANLIISTISVTTSFAAVYLTFRRSPLYALMYAANDIVLIVLWVLAAVDNTAYVSVVICFAVFFVNDIYGFISWRNMEQEQRPDAGTND